MRLPHAGKKRGCGCQVGVFPHEIEAITVPCKRHKKVWVQNGQAQGQQRRLEGMMRYKR